MNRFYQRRLGNQYVPMSMESMMMLPQAMTQAHQQKIMELAQAKNIPFSAATSSDSEEVGQKLNQFSQKVDSYTDKLMTSGVSSISTSDMSTLANEYQNTKMYADAANARYAQFKAFNDVLEDVVKNDASQRDWVNNIKSANMQMMANTKMNLDEKTGEYNSFNFTDVVKRPDIAKKLEESLSRVKAGKYTSNLMPAAMDYMGADGKMKSQGVPGMFMYSSTVSKEGNDLLAAIMEVSMDPEVVAYLRLYSQINPMVDEAGNAINITGLDPSNYFLEFDDTGNIKTDKITGDPVFNTNTIFGLMAHKGYQGHNNPEITKNFTQAPSGSRSVKSGGSGNRIGIDFTIVGEPRKLDSEGVESNQYRHNAYIDRVNAKSEIERGIEESKQNIEFDLKGDPKNPNRPGLLRSIIQSPQLSKTFGIGENGYSPYKFENDTRSFIQALSKQERFKNLTDKTFSERVAEVKNELIKDGISADYIEAVINSNADSYFESIVNTGVKLYEDNLLLAATNAEIETFKNKLETANPEYAEYQKTFESEVDQLIDLYQRNLQAGVGFRDDWFQENKSDAEILAALDELKADLLNLPFVAAEKYSTGYNVSFREARQVLDNLLTDKYSDILKTNGAPMNFLTNVARTVLGAFSDYAELDLRQSEIYSVGSKMFGDGTIYRGGQPTTAINEDVFSQGPGGESSDSDILWNIKRSIEDLADIIGKEGSTLEIPDMSKETTLLHIEGISNNSKALTSSLDVINKYPVTSLTNLITPDGRPIKDVIGEMTGFNDFVFKPNEYTITPAISTSEDNSSYDLSFVISGAVHQVVSNGKVQSAPTQLTAPLVVKLSSKSDDAQTAAINSYMMDAWLDMNNSQYYDGEALDALNKYFSSLALYPSDRAVLFSKFNDPSVDQFQITLNYKSPDQYGIGSTRPLSKETVTFNRNSTDGFRWTMNFSSNPSESVPVDSYSNALAYFGKQASIIMNQYTMAQSPYNYAQ